MKEGWLLNTFQTALAKVPGCENYPEPLFPTLPIVEATEFGQHVLVTFSLSVPPPALLVAAGAFQPAVTLHLIWPEGYCYWQPETGMPHYLGGVREIGELPPLYQDILGSCCQSAATLPGGALARPGIRGYLKLVEQVLVQQWLSPHEEYSAEEKQVATQLKAALAQLCEPEYQAYYHTRGRALFEWLARATYEKNWIEAALELVPATRPTWVSSLESEATKLCIAEPLPAVLDGRQCLVVALYRSAEYLPLAVCYIFYPEQEVRWQQLEQRVYVGLLAPTQLTHKQLLTKRTAAPTTETEQLSLIQQYRQFLTTLLARKWLITRYPATPEEVTVANALRECLSLVYVPSLSAFYQRDIWQFFGWLARLTNS